MWIEIGIYASSLIFSEQVFSNIFFQTYISKQQSSGENADANQGALPRGPQFAEEKSHANGQINQ